MISFGLGAYQIRQSLKPQLSEAKNITKSENLVESTEKSAKSSIEKTVVSDSKLDIKNSIDNDKTQVATHIKQRALERNVSNEEINNV